MPIQVYCGECQFEFMVGDEFAGKPGRCPECHAIIMVPDAENPDHEPDEPFHDPSPYHTPRAVEAYEDFPVRPVRKDPEPELPVRTYRGEEPTSERTFNVADRARRWRSVQRALGYSQVAMLLGFLSLIPQTILTVARGGELPNERDGLDSGQIAMAFASLGLTLASFLFWVMGRGWIMRSPYVPVRGPARIGFILTLLSIGGMVLTFCCMFVVAVQAAQAQMNGGQPGDAIVMVLMLMAFMAVTAAMLLGSEIAFLVAVGRVGDGIKDRGAAGWARRSIVVLVLSAMACFFGVMIGFVILGAAAQKKQAEAKQAAPQPKAAKERQAKNDKAKEEPKANDKPPAPNAPPPEPPPPDPIGLLVFELSFLGPLLIYFLHAGIALQTSRRAIGREIRRLTEAEGEISEHDPVHRF